MCSCHGPPHRPFSLLFLLIPGAPPPVRASPARGRGDEAGPDLARLGAVPQDLHPEARERQVSEREEPSLVESIDGFQVA